MATDTQTYLKQLESLRRWARGRQDTERGMVTFREVAKRYGVKLDTVESMVYDAELSYNCGYQVGGLGGGVGEIENRGDYTIEDLNAQQEGGNGNG